MEILRRIFKKKQKVKKEVEQKEVPLVLVEENKPEVKSEKKETKETKSETTSSLTFGE